MSSLRKHPSILNLLDILSCFDFHLSLENFLNRLNILSYLCFHPSLDHFYFYFGSNLVIEDNVIRIQYGFQKVVINVRNIVTLQNFIIITITNNTKND